MVQYAIVESKKMAALKRLPFKNMILELSTKENMVERRQNHRFYTVSEPQASVTVSVIELTTARKRQRGSDRADYSS